MHERTNAQWLEDLSPPNPHQEHALADLRQEILRGLPFSLSGWLSPTDPRFAPLAEEVAQETLLRVLAHLHTFEGRSKFTTWVHKIAVRVAYSELRRKRWQSVSLEISENEDDPAAEKWLADPAASPERVVEGQDLMKRVKRILAEELTDKQRQAMTAMALTGMPMEELARRMNTNRNALYKLIHDARLKLKRRLAQEGLSPEDLLATFGNQ